MKFRSFLAAAIIAAVPLGALAADDTREPKLRPPGDIGRLSITFDGALTNFYTVAFPIMQKAKFPGTIYLRSGYVAKEGDPSATTITWGNIKEMVEAKWDVGASAFTEIDLAAATPEQIQQDLADSSAIIARYAGVSPSTYAVPGGVVPDALYELVPIYYDGMLVSIEYDPKRPFGHNADTASPMYVERLQIKGDTTAETICKEISWAARENYWLVLNVKDIAASEQGNGGYYQISPDTLALVTQCAAKYVKSNELKIVTVGEMINNLVPPVLAAADAEVVAAE